MALLKYNGNLISTGTGLLGYTSTVPGLTNGGWKHKDTGAWTEFAEFFPNYGEDEGVVTFDGGSLTDPESIGHYAHNISELIIREGCHVVININRSQHPDTQEWLYDSLTSMDFPSTVTDIGPDGGSIFNDLGNVLVIKIRAIAPPEIRVGTMQSPNARIYVPDASVDTYKNHPSIAPYASLILPLSDIE